MSDHTPTTADVREVYCYDTSMYPEFNAWLAGVQAEALREAADALSSLDKSGDAVFWTGEVYEFVPYWLHTRADELEAQQ